MDALRDLAGHHVAVAHGRTGNEITKTMAFLQLQEQFYRKREEGSKSAHEDERWQRLWRLYEDLGDGEGDSLKREWEKIPIK